MLAAMDAEAPAAPGDRGRLAEVAAVFGVLGWRAFGGPVAHVALMRRAVVQRRGWVAEADFAALFAACSLLPGPGSTQLALLLGRRRAGLPGMLVAAALFIGPAVLVMLVLGEVYLHIGTGHAVATVLLGVEAAVVAIVARAAFDLALLAARRPESAVVAIAAAAAGIAAVSPGVILAGGGGAGAAAWLARRWRDRRSATAATTAEPDHRASRLLVLAAVGGPAKAASAGTLLSLALTFLKIGAVAFGSGYVLLSFLHADLVGDRFGLDDHQIADAVAAAQATPGPVFAVAAFLGVQVAGLPGGLVAAAAVFAPSLVLVLLADPLVRAVSARPGLRAALDGVLAAALGLIVAAVVALARAAFTGSAEFAVAVVALLLLLRWPGATPAAVALGAAAGGVLALTGG